MAGLTRGVTNGVVSAEPTRGEGCDDGAAPDCQTDSDPRKPCRGDWVNTCPGVRPKMIWPTCADGPRGAATDEDARPDFAET
mmetsp:Transcript_56404/g.163574  ORF Transcript_56404/g.163574 Transcript_56404/m.163574 type:complete len:82 (+) Transcript_56404:1482-1727(+)